MFERSKEVLGRGKTRRIVSTLVVLSTVLVGLANAGTAIDTVGALWKKWVIPAPALDTTWQGIWQTIDGYKFSFAMQLTVRPDDTANGEIRWRLLETPPKSFLSGRVNSDAIEFVSGKYDRETLAAEVQGYRVSDPTLIVNDNYKFQILSDKVTFEAITRGSGDRWDGSAHGRVIVIPKKE